MGEAPAWVILQRIAAALGAITVAGGYFTDAGNHVDLERDPLSAGNVFPRIALAEDTSEVTSSTLTTNGVSVMTPMKVIAEGYIALTTESAEQLAQRVKFDMTRALAQIRSSNFEGIEGATVSRFEIIGDRPTLRRPDGINFIVVQVRATVTFTAYFPPVTGQ